jgi:hypothetical protein
LDLTTNDAVNEIAIRIAFDRNSSMAALRVDPRLFGQKLAALKPLSETGPGTQ